MFNNLYFYICNLQNCWTKKDMQVLSNIYNIYIQIQKNWKNTSYKLDIQAISKNIF